MSVNTFKAWIWMILGAVFYALAIVGGSISARASHEMSQLPALSSNVTVAPIESRELTGFLLMILSPLAAMFCTFLSGRSFVLAANSKKGVV